MLVRQLARSGLLEYRFGPSKGGSDKVVIEPQMPDYWPQAATVAAGDRIALSRFAYLRRRGDDMILESPRAAALFRIADPDIAAALDTLAMPQTLAKLRRQEGFPGAELIGLLLDCGMLFGRRRRQRGPACRRRRRQSRALGFPRSVVPYPLHRRPAGQSVGRAVSLCGHYAAAAIGTARNGLARPSTCSTFCRPVEHSLTAR